MALTLTLTPTSGSILAVISGLSIEHEEKRRFVWYLDGEIIATEIVEPGSAEYEYELAPAYCCTSHTVLVEIYNEEGTEFFASLSGTATTLLPTIIPWTWSASNGTASEVQTETAYQALINKDLTVNFSRLVWNDLVDKTAELRKKAGLPWLRNYGNIANIRMEEAYSDLSANRFNALISNIDYPFWTWTKLPNQTGYIGRVDMRGISSVGETNADVVYGRYLIELAKRLNTVIGIYTDTGNLIRLAETISIYSTVTSPLIADPSAAMRIVLNPTLNIFNRNMIADPSRPLNVDLALTADIPASMSVERYRLLNAILGSQLKNESLIRCRLPFSLLVDTELGSFNSANLESGSPELFETSLNLLGNISADMGRIALTAIMAELVSQISTTSDLSIQRNLGARTETLINLGLENRNLIKSVPRPLSQVSTPLECLAVSIGAIQKPLPIPIVNMVGQADSIVSGDIIRGFNLNISAECSYSFNATSDKLTSLSIPKGVVSSELSTSLKLSNIMLLPLTADTAATLTIDASEGGAIPGDAWKNQIGTELTIWRTINSRQRDDIVMVDIDPKPAELTFIETTTLDTSASVFLSKGWEFPTRLPNGKGRILLIKQLLSVDADNWGLLREGEFTFYRTDNSRSRGDMVLVDIDPKNAAISADSPISVDISATGLISKGWVFPERVPNGNGKILIVKQAIEVVQINDTLEVE